MKSVVKFHGFLGKLSGLSGFELGFSRDPWWLYRIYVGSCGFYMGLKQSMRPQQIGHLSRCMIFHHGEI